MVSLLSVGFGLCHPDSKEPVLTSLDMFDIFAYLKTETGRSSKRVVSVRASVAIPTGITLNIPPRHVALLSTRPSYIRNSVFVMNSVLEPSKEEVEVLLYNGGHEAFYVEHEHRIAQLTVISIATIKLQGAHP